MSTFPATASGGFRYLSVIFIVPFLLLLTPLGAQEMPMEDAAGLETGFQSTMSIGLNTGTHALYGADVTLGILKPVNFRISYNSIRASLSDFSVDAGTLGVDGQTLLIDSDINLSTIGFLVDFPFTRSKKLRLMAGAMFELDNSITIAGRFTESIFINDFELTPERLGSIGSTYRTESSIYPYLGLGFGRSLAANKLTFAFEAGVYMRGKPAITVQSDGVLAGNEANGPVLSNNLESLQFHPSIGIRLAYGFALGSPKSKETTQDDLMEPEKEAPDEAPLITEDMREAPMEEEEAEKPSRKNRKEEAEEIVEAPAQQPATPAKPVTPYLSLKGQVVDSGDGNNLPYVILDMYKVLPDGQKQKALSQRYPGGSFDIALERGATYEIRLQHYLYTDTVVTIQADSDPSKAEETRSFTMNQQ